LTVAGYLVGEDRTSVVGDLLRGSDVIRAALLRIADHLAEFARRSVAAGAAGVFYAISGHASDDLWAPDDYERRVLVSDLAVLEALGEDAWFTVLHLCGPRVHFGLATRLPVRAVSWSVHEPRNPTLAEGRDRSGMAVMRGVDHHRTLITGSPEAVRGEVRAALLQTGGDGVLIAPGCSVPPEAPEENLVEMMDAARA
jgi:uroporphyrinogen decarboxylase